MLMVAVSEPEDAERAYGALRVLARAMERELPDDMPVLECVEWVAREFCGMAGIDVIAARLDRAQWGWLPQALALQGPSSPQREALARPVLDPGLFARPA